MSRTDDMLVDQVPGPPAEPGRRHARGRSRVASSSWATASGSMDAWLVLSAGLLLLIGEVMVFNTTYFHASERFGDPYRFVWKHQVAIGLGVCGLLLTTACPSTLYRRLAYPVLGFAVLLLCVVFLPGVSGGAVRRWIPLGVVHFQPSELAKGAVVLYLAHSLAKKSGRLQDLIYGVLPHVMVVAVVVVLILCEPDLGGAAFVTLTLLALLFVGGARARHLATIVGCGLVLLVYGVTSARYREARIVAFLTPGAHLQTTGYQLDQSLLAFGAGGFDGTGLGQGQQKMFYLPEAHTDFVFAVIGEETGLLGALGVLFLFVLFGARGMLIAWRHPSLFGRLLAFGATFIIVGQAGINMAVVLGLLPTKGLPLPFISYGGSSLVMSVAYTGVLLALSREIPRRSSTDG